MDEQVAPGKTQTQKGRIQKIEGQNTQTWPEHARKRLGKPKPKWHQILSGVSKTRGRSSVST